MGYYPRTAHGNTNTSGYGNVNLYTSTIGAEQPKPSGKTGLSQSLTPPTRGKLAAYTQPAKNHCPFPIRLRIYIHSLHFINEHEFTESSKKRRVSPGHSKACGADHRFLPPRHRREIHKAEFAASNRSNTSYQFQVKSGEFKEPVTRPARPCRDASAAD